MVKGEKIFLVFDELLNLINVEESLKRIKENDVYFVEVNLNNIKNILILILKDFVKVLEINIYVKCFSFVVIWSNDFVVIVFVEMLKVNKILKSLNVEFNFIMGVGILVLIDVLRDNEILVEFKIDN